jgi:hypothetical protein
MPYYSVAASYGGVHFKHKQFKLFRCSLVGSINGSDWYLLDTQTRTTPSADYTGSMGNTEVYRYYRVIVTTGDPSMLINASGINGLFISGYYADRIQTGVSLRPRIPK